MGVDELSDSTEVVEMEGVNPTQLRVDKHAWDGLREIVQDAAATAREVPPDFQFIRKDEASPRSHRFYHLGELQDRKCNDRLKQRLKSAIFCSKCKARGSLICWLAD